MHVAEKRNTLKFSQAPTRSSCLTHSDVCRQTLISYMIIIH